MQQIKSSTINYIGKTRMSWYDEEAIKHIGKIWVGLIFKLSHQDAISVAKKSFHQSKDDLQEMEPVFQNQLKMHV